MGSPLAQVARGVRSFGSARMLSQLGMFLAMVALARLTTPSDFGSISFVLAVTTILYTFGDQGMSTVVQRYVGELGEDVIRPAFAVKLLACTVVGAAAWALDSGLGLLRGLGGWIGLITLLSAFQLVIMTENARQRFRSAGALQLTTTALFAFGAMALAILWDPVAGPLLARSVSFAVVGLGLLTVLLRGPGPMRVPGFGRALRMGGGVTLNSVFTQVLTRSDIVIVTYIVGFEAAGVYRAAYTLGMLPLLLQPLIHLPLMPVVAEQLKQGRRDQVTRIHAVITGGLIVVLAPVVIGGWVLSEPLLLHVFGADYTRGVWVLRLLLVASSASVLIAPIGGIFFMEGKIRPMAAATASCALVMLAVGLWSTPRYGGAGAAMAACMGQGLWALALLMLYKRSNALEAPGRRALPFALAAAVTLGMSLALAPLVSGLMTLVLALVLITGIYAGCALALGVVRPGMLRAAIGGGDRRAD